MCKTVLFRLKEHAFINIITFMKVVIQFLMMCSLPEWIVVPSSATDLQLLEASRHFRAGRPPLWCWSSPHGAALARMADIHPYITDR